MDVWISWLLMALVIALSVCLGWFLSVARIRLSVFREGFERGVEAERRRQGLDVTAIPPRVVETPKPTRASLRAERNRKRKDRRVTWSPK